MRVGVSELVGVIVAVLVGVLVGVRVGVRELVGVVVAVPVGVRVGVSELVGVEVAVFVGVLVGGLVGVKLAVGAGVGVSVGIGLLVGVNVGPVTCTEPPVQLPGPPSVSLPSESVKAQVLPMGMMLPGTAETEGVKLQVRISPLGRGPEPQATATRTIPAIGSAAE